MNRIKNEFYTILDFPLIENEIVRLSLGLIGFLFILRQSPSHICYVPSRFRQTLHTKCKQDLTQFLLDNGYLQLYQRPKKQKDPDDEMFLITKSGKRYSYTELKRGFKKIPYLYIPTTKLTKLRQIKLRDEKMTKWIDEHLHLLNDQYFNHYNHSYKYIKIDNIPKYSDYDEEYFNRNIIDEYGHPENKEYHIDGFGYDLNNWAGNHVNIFTDNKFLIRYTNLVKPIEIGLLFSEPLIIADQLIKTIGSNDFSAWYLKTRFNKLTYKKINGKKTLIAWHKDPLFKLLSDYDITTEIFDIRLIMALFEYTNVSEFAAIFPEAWNILYNIKSGRLFENFVSNMKPPIYKTDYRLILGKDHQAFKRGQLFYLVVYLVYQLRITQIMREIWQRLKKCDIIFIPLKDSVVVSSLEEKATTYIVETTLKKHIDSKLHFVVSKEKHYL